MNVTKEVVQKLSEPFNPAEIEWRAGATTRDKSKALALAYITARAVMNRLDEVVGPENWSDSYVQIEGTGKRGFICTLAIRTNGEWVSKSDGADESDIESIKGGLSDAFKRAANKWGVGRYLYDLPDFWVSCEAFGNTVKLTDTPKLPAYALPAGFSYRDGKTGSDKAGTKPVQQTGALSQAAADELGAKVTKVEQPKDGIPGEIAETIGLSAKTLTLEQAGALTSHSNGSTGKAYALFTVAELSARFNAYSKKLKDTESLSGEERNAYEVRQAAAQMLMKAVSETNRK